jgi:hypothetical protein
MVYIYTLKLQNNKYYVGKTNNPQFRFDAHFDAGGSAFTKKFKPLEIHQLVPDCSDHDEQRITQEYMGTYGIQNVRGGPWTQMLLSDEEEDFIQKLLDSETDACYECGSQGHFANKCPNKHQKTTYPQMSKKKVVYDVWHCEFCGKEFDSKKGCSFHENIHCTKRRNTHKNYDPAIDLRDELYETSSEYDSDETSSEYDSESDEYESEGGVTCYRCGRGGHYATTCYAKKHIRGSWL